MIVDGHVDLDGSVGIRSSRATIEGSDRIGSITAAPRPATGAQTPLLSIAPSNADGWAIIGRLTLVVLDGNDTILKRTDSGDIMLRSGSVGHPLVDTADLGLVSRRRGKDGATLDVRLPAAAPGARLWWRFEWTAIDGGVTVRALG